METIVDVLEAIHREYTNGDTSYPLASSEDHNFRLRFVIAGIAIWEKESVNGMRWPELTAEDTVTATGAGQDTLPSDFLTTYRSSRSAARFRIGTIEYVQKTVSVGQFRKRENITTEPVFWITGKKLNTFPVATTDFILPYVRKAARPVTGTETDVLDIPLPEYLVNYALAMLYMDDQNHAKMSYYLQRAEDFMSDMKGAAINEHTEESDFGFGM